MITHPVEATSPPPKEARPTPWWQEPTVIALAIAVVVYLVYWRLSGPHHVERDYFVPLAEALLHGRLDVGRLPDFYDELVPAGGKWYVVYPPLPALLVMPWVLFKHLATNQLGPCLMFGAFNAGLVFDVVRRFGHSNAQAMLFAGLFAFGTVHWFGASDGAVWHFAQVCGLTFLWLAIREAAVEGPAWRMGLWLGAAMLCRLDLVMAFPFFLAFLAHRSRRDGAATGVAVQRFVFQALGFGSAAGAFVALYLAYNAARFGNPLETGYAMIPGILNEPWYRDGFWAWSAVPRNLHALLLRGPVFSEVFPYLRPPHIGGMSLLLTTPAFLWAIKARRPDWWCVGSWLAVAAIALPIVTHGETGGAEFGYRYAMDFYPFLLLLTLRGMGDRPSVEAKLAIGLSVLVNLWGIWASTTGNWG